MLYDLPRESFKEIVSCEELLHRSFTKGGGVTVFARLSISYMFNLQLKFIRDRLTVIRKHKHHMHE